MNEFFGEIEVFVKKRVSYIYIYTPIQAVAYRERRSGRVARAALPKRAARRKSGRQKKIVKNRSSEISAKIVGSLNQLNDETRIIFTGRRHGI